MELISSLLGAFLGAFTGCLIFLYFVYPKTVSGQHEQTEQDRIYEAKKTKQATKSIPKGAVLKSPNPEDERKRKAIEFEQRVYERK